MNNLHDIKVDATVYHLLHGWEGKVVGIRPKEEFPLCIECGSNQDWYRADGRMFAEDVNPTWVANPPINPGSTEMRTVADGTTNEDVLSMLIERTRYLNGLFPCRENTFAIIKMEEAVMWFEKRTADRLKRQVEGTHQA